MKNLILILSIFSTNFLSQAQWSDNGNFIRNNSFEQVNFVVWESLCQMVTTNEDEDLGNGILNTEHCPDNGTSGYNYFVEYWDQIDYWTVPDQKTSLFVQDPYVGTPDLLTNTYVSASTFGQARTGEAWLGVVAYEYIVAEFEQPLIDGDLYYLEFFFNTRENQEATISIYDQKPQHKLKTGSGTGKPIEDHNKEHNQTIFSQDMTYLMGNIHDWTRIRVYFTPSTNMTWMSIGMSGMFDDIKLYHMDDPCRDEWYFDNTVFNYPVEIFQATNFIEAGTGVDPEAGQLDGPVTVLNGTNLLFRAGSVIELGPGFTVEAGALFEAVIGPCQPLCVPLQPPQLSYDCVNTAISIGNEIYNDTYTDLTWSPGTYLDDPTAENPVFTPPPGQTGSITYTVTYNNTCPLATFPFPIELQYQVTVNYIDPALLTIPPTVNYSNLTFDDQEISVQLDFNDAVSWFEVVVYDGNGILDYYENYDRGIDFTSNSMNLSFGNDVVIFWSNCMDYHFVINAHNECADQVATVEFDWTKTWDSNSEISASLPNAVTAQDNDGDNDYYCFSHFGADHYELKIYYENNGVSGPLVYEETGLITDDSYFCTYFDGHASNGNLLNEDAYLAQLNLYNWCGDELIIPASESTLFHLILPGKSQVADSTNFFDEKEGDVSEPQVIITTNQNVLNIRSEIGSENEIIITNVVGEIIFGGSFGNHFNLPLSSGIYFVAVESENGLVVKKKIVIV